MRDMFYNYEHNINKKEYPEMPCSDDRTRILESDPNMQLVLDVFGNEMGICVRQGQEFTLCFTMCGEVEGSSISELVLNSQICFDIVDYWHQTVITKIYSPLDVYCSEDEAIYITVSREDALKLKQETYKMRLSLSWPGGGYELYSEHNGFLTIK